MSLLYLSRRNGAQTLLKALTQPSSSAAMTSTAAGGTPLPETIIGPADAYTHRRWSHYAASTSSTSHSSSFSPISGQRRAFSAGENNTVAGDGKSGSSINESVSTQPSPTSSPRRLAQAITSTVDGKDPNPRPPGAALKRAAHALDHLNSKEPDLPPWQAASHERLSQELFEYRNDLASAKKSVTAARRSSNKPSLPFIGEAFSSIVDAERAALASPYDSSSSGGSGSGNKIISMNKRYATISARSRNKLTGYAQLRAVLDMKPGQDGQRNGTSSQLYDQMWSDNTQEIESTAAAADFSDRATREQVHEHHQQQGKLVKPVGADEAQTLLAAKANEVIGVLTAVELLLPLAPWQRRVVSRAVVESKNTREPINNESEWKRDNSNDGSIHQTASTSSTTTTTTAAITAHSARTAVSFLLTECGLTHRQAAHAISEHPWLLGIENIRSQCSGLLESLHLLNMDPASVAAVVAAHPPALLMNADKEIIPLLEYLNGLGFPEEDAAELIRAAPKLLLDPVAKQRLAGCIAFWVGQGMSRPSLRALLTAAPEVTSMSLRLLQLKTEWLMEQAGFSIEDIATVPSAVQLPLAAHVAPRIAFARHRGFTVDPPSSSSFSKKRSILNDFFSSSSSRDLSIESLLSSSEVDFLNSVGNATDAEFRAFEAAWRDSNLSTWFKSRLSGPSVTQYENMEWIAEEEMAPLREMHDHHVALREIAWEQQQDREKEWETVWGDWKRAQARRDQLETWTRRMKKRREDEALRRATIEMTMLAESQGVRRPGMCLKSPYCNRKINHPGMCNQKLALKMNFNIEDYATSSADTGATDTGVTSSGEFSIPSVEAVDAENAFLNNNVGGLGPGSLRGQTVHDIATASEVDAGLYLFGSIKNDVPADEDENGNLSFGHLTNTTIDTTLGISTDTSSSSLDIDPSLTPAWTTSTSTHSQSTLAINPTAAALNLNLDGSLILGDGPTITKEEIENQDIDQVLHCYSGLEALLERAPFGILSHRTVNAWADRQGYSRAVSTAAKGVLAATGTARVVVEPNFAYHKVAPKAWQLLRTGNNNNSTKLSLEQRDPPPRLTRTAANVAILSNLVIKMIDSLPEGVIQRKDLRSWAELRWKGSSKLHLRAVVAGLLEQGLVVQRRRKGISSGPMEVAQVDLKRYLQGLSQHYSNMSLVEKNGGVAGSGQGGDEFIERKTIFSSSGDDGGDEFLSINNGSTSSTTEKIRNAHINFVVDAHQPRSALIRRVRFTDDDWTRFENLPRGQVRSCVDGLLELLRSVPESVPHRILASWAAQQGYDKETLTAAKAVMFTEGSAQVSVEPRGNGSSGGGGYSAQKMWVATDNYSTNSTGNRTSTTLSEVQNINNSEFSSVHGLPLHKMLQTVREARGGFLTKGELRAWAKEYMGQDWQGVGALNLAIGTLIESGCLVQLGALPLVDGKRSKLLVAVNLRQYEQGNEEVE